MNIQEQIDGYISEQPEAKRDDMRELHRIITRASPTARLWFLDGKNSAGKIVSNPNIGYGETALKYANGDEREFYRIGVSANSAGLSIYVMGIDDKNYLSETYGHRLGKAKISGYCVKFKSMSDLDGDVLEEMVASHLNGPTCSS